MPENQWTADRQRTRASFDRRPATEPFADEVQIIPTSEGEITTKVFNKTRPDDFVKELNHIKDVLNGGAESPIDLNFGLDTMRVIHAAHKSNISDKTENIDYNCTFLEL